MTVIRMGLAFMLALLFPTTLLFAQHSLGVDIKGLHSTKGSVYISLFRSEAGFPDQAELAFQKGKIFRLEAASALYTFTDLPSGHYAVSAYHDEDGDGRVKKNTLGIPLEGTAASNDAKGKFGPPKFIDAKFRIDGDKRISVTMRYF